MITKTLIALGLGIVALMYSGQVLSNPVKEKLRAACPECEIDWAAFHWGPQSIELTNFYFRSNADLTTVVTASGEQLKVKLNWKKILRGQWFFDKVEIDKLTVEVEEIDGQDPQSPPGTEPNLYIGSVKVKDGKFIYRKKEKQGTGVITITNIQAETTRFSTEHKTERTQGQAQALLEGVGKIDLKVSAVVFAPAPEVNVDLKLTDMPLDKVNAYFTPMDGVRLSGLLQAGQSMVEVRGRKQTAWAQVKYRQFDLHFLPHKDRSGLTARLSNLFADITLNPYKSTTEKKGQRLSRGRESLVSFILKGMKLSVMKLATYKQKRRR